MSVFLQKAELSRLSQEIVNRSKSASETENGVNETKKTRQIVCRGIGIYIFVMSIFSIEKFVLCWNVSKSTRTG